MTIIQDYQDTLTPSHITTAIQEHLENPSIPVTRICKTHGISRATFYRHLGRLYPKAQPEIIEESYSCPLCGKSYPVNSTDEELLKHLSSCPMANGHTKSDARRMLREMGCTTSYDQPPSTSTISESTQGTIQELSESSKNTESVLEPITATDDLFAKAKFDENGNVRPGWDYKTWLNFWWENVPKTSTKNCHTATSPHRTKRR